MPPFTRLDAPHGRPERRRPLTLPLIAAVHAAGTTPRPIGAPPTSGPIP